MSVDQKTRANLLAQAIAVRENAHAPYSGYKVGAALLLDSGEIITGCNVENASYGLTICAERTAIFRAVAKHGPQKFKAIAVSVKAPTTPATAPPANELSPCGACRQVMAEFMSDDAQVFVDGSRDYTIGELLPDAFRIPGMSL